MGVVSHNSKSAFGAALLAAAEDRDRLDLARHAETDQPDRSERSVPCDRAKQFSFARSVVAF